MLEYFAFTFYEIVGYLLPGGVALLGLMLLYWALFVPSVPLEIASFKPRLGTWTSLLVVSYVLGQAVQAVANKLLIDVATSALAMGKLGWVSECARQAAAELMGIPVEKIESNRVVYMVLDEYTVQAGKPPNDRDMFIYRENHENFYRGTCIALFFLSATLLARMAFPGTSIQFTKWLFPVSRWQLLLTAAITGGIGRLFFQRYKLFTEYSVTRAVLAALVIKNTSAHRDSSGNIPEPPAE
jgi:hypothetical protein